MWFLLRKVYEEKQRRCEREMEELRQTCAAKMKQTSQKAQRSQQVLQLQVGLLWKLSPGLKVEKYKNESLHWI